MGTSTTLTPAPTRQAWWVGDVVRLPQRTTCGVVVQVDRAARFYRVDVGGDLVVVPWHAVEITPERSSGESAHYGPRYEG